MIEINGIKIDVRTEDNYIVELFFNESSHQAISPLHQLAFTQLTEYFNGQRQQFDLPIKLEGTAFQKAVWQQLQEIPFGQTWSYQAIAENISRPQSIRAVGNAVGKNPIPIIVPCHRVIRQDGSLGGFSGGIDIKIKLLEVER